ncbi:MAG: MxaS protein, partial [Paraburkholderia caledonica]
MKEIAEFHYRLPMRSSGFRPGSHRGSSFGAGQEFAMHGRLFDYPDPRRIDLRASVRAARSEWLVRVHLQRAAVPVQVL